jgi:integrase
VGIDKPRLHAFRHSYTAARIQTTEHGMPISIWQVAVELGHKGTQMIEKRYGHLVTVTDRREFVEFTLEGAPEAIREDVVARATALSR